MRRYTHIQFILKQHQPKPKQKQQPASQPANKQPINVYMYVQ